VEESSSGQERQAVTKVQTAEKITGKKWQVHTLVAVRQTSAALIQRQELL
jgi:hypothetical protein